MRFDAHEDVVVVKVDKNEEKVNGIFIPHEQQKSRNSGEVFGVGEGRTIKYTGAIIPMSVKIGDRVMFAEGSGTKVEHEGNTYRVMREKDILGIWN